MKRKKQTLGRELIESIKEVLQKPKLLKTVRTGVDVKNLRSSLHMTQKSFATTFGFSVETLRKWEQGVNSPDKSVLSYLICIKKAPNYIARLLKQA
jgi:putative transcriptional regulator